MQASNGIGIVGSRRRDTPSDAAVVIKAFEDIYQEGDWIISGGCPKGGDRFAEWIAKNYGIPILIFYPNWARYGRSAGFIRNIPIAEYSTKALIACVAEDRTGGTEDTIKKFRQVQTKAQLILC